MKGKYAKPKLIKILEEMPIISYAVKQCGVGRSTIYRWYKDDLHFRKSVDKALELGRAHLINVMEMALIRKADKGDLRAIIFYLQHNDKRYAPKRSIYVPPHLQHLKPGEICEYCEQVKAPEMSREKMIEKMKQAIADQEDLEKEYEEAGYDLDASLKEKGLVRLPGRDKLTDIPHVK